MIGGLFVYNHKGEVLISRIYRDDVRLLIYIHVFFFFFFIKIKLPRAIANANSAIIHYMNTMISGYLINNFFCETGRLNVLVIKMLLIFFQSNVRSYACIYALISTFKRYRKFNEKNRRLLGLGRF